MKLENWWTNAFERGVYPLAALADSPAFLDKTRAEIPFLARVLRLRRADSLLDVCCGIGRHSIPLGSRGVSVTGLDISARYLKEARRRARSAGVAVRFTRGDMREMPFAGRFDAAVNLYTSFGYFPKASDDLAALRSICRALKPGGRFFLDLFNGFRNEYLLRWQEWMQLSPNRWSELTDGTILLESPELRLKERAIVTRWRVMRGRRRRDMLSFTRLYTRRRLTGLLRRAGFRVLRVFGEIGPERYDARHSRRLAVLAERPGNAQ